MNTRTIDLDVSKKPAAVPVLYLGQRDRYGATLKARVFDNGAALPLSGMSARLVILLPDGKTVYSASSNSRSGNTATFNLSAAVVTSIAGQTDVAYVQITSGESTTTTNRFTVIVHESAQR